MEDKITTPKWIGIEIPMTNTTIKICLGIDNDLEHGLDISFTTPEDIEAVKGTEYSPWQDGNKNVGEIKVALVYGDKRVFDDSHNLIDGKII